MPYQFVKVESRRHRHLYLPLNRNYKPLGQISAEHVRHEDYTAQAVIFQSDPHRIRNVWTDPEQLYLYNDAPSSRSDYFARYEKLLSRSMNLSGATSGRRR
jgi:hypothetical protein